MCDRCGDARCSDPDSKWCSDILLMRYKAEADALRQTLTSMRIAIVSVLCDPEEEPCFHGSQGDRAVIRAAIKDIDAALRSQDAAPSEGEK